MSDISYNTQGPQRSPEKIVQIDKHIWLSQCWLIEEPNIFFMIIKWFFIWTFELESPSPKDALWQVWMKLAQLLLRRFLNFVNVFSQFRNYLPLERTGPFIWTNLNTFTQECIVPSLVDIDPVDIKKKMFKFRPCIFAIS